MAEYFFVLGKAATLCQAELESVLKREKVFFKIVFSSPEIVHVSTDNLLDADYLIKTLGGTIKIAQVAGSEFSLERIVSYLKEQTKDKKIVFGISGYNGINFNALEQWDKEVKEELEKQGWGVRFILPPREETSLSSVVIKKQDALEVILVKEKEKLVFAKTLAVQDFQGWGKRDFQRPAPDPHQGMLPPKVARMMVNLGIREQAAGNSQTILDPFCGVGTILAEGMMVGCQVLGSDQSQEAVEKTRKNLEWLNNNYQVPSTNFQLFTLDATHISEKLQSDSVDAIVTEPYLGPMAEHGTLDLKHKKIENIILGLDKLYLGCFREWAKVLKAGGKIVIALPSFKVGGQEIFVKKALDTCENLGYTLLAGPYQYSRPQAIVTRNIYLLKYGPH